MLRIDTLPFVETYSNQLLLGGIMSKTKLQ